MSEIDDYYHGPTWWPLAVLRRAVWSAGGRRLLLAWLAVSAVAILSAVLEAAWDWTGLPITLGPVTLAVTAYPPLFFALLLTLWIGPSWGVIPAYLSTLVSALYSGIPFSVAALFALATPVEILLVWGSMVTLNIHPDLQRGRDLWQYLIVALIAATASSLAALIWNQAQGLDLAERHSVWQGWLLGDLIQLAILAPLALHWLGGPARQWVDRKLATPPHQTVSYTRGVVLVVVLLGMLGALVFQGVGMTVEALQTVAEDTSPESDIVLDRLTEIGLFFGLLFIVALLTTLVFSSALARISERERQAGLRDTLTGCFNRRAFSDLFQREAERSRRLHEGVSVIFYDIDDFKKVNDRYGHAVGDAVLRQLPQRVRNVMREHDFLFRWGGEEFVVLVPHAAPGDAEHLAERIRRAVADTPLVTHGVAAPVSVTLSLGTASTQDFPANPERLIAQADAACYRAKHEGRNRVASHVSVG